jgi:hypothetical protein
MKISAVAVVELQEDDTLRGVARGSRQRSMLSSLLTDPEGIQTDDWDYSATQTRLHGSAGWKAFCGMRSRLDTALLPLGCWVGQLALGPKGGKRWTVVTDDRLIGAPAAVEAFAAMYPTWEQSTDDLIDCLINGLIEVAVEGTGGHPAA